MDSVSEDSGFGWELLSNKWKVYYEGDRGSIDVLTVDKNGLYVKGKIEADSGYIGDWTIGNRAIYNGTESPEVDTYTKMGTYIGTDGFLNYLSDDRYVQIRNGSIVAHGATIYGNINAESGSIGGWRINSRYIGSSTDYGESFYIASASDISDYWIRAYDGNSTTFGVGKDGILFAHGR